MEIDTRSTIVTQFKRVSFGRNISQKLNISYKGVQYTVKIFISIESLQNRSRLGSDIQFRRFRKEINNKLLPGFVKE